MGYSPWGHKESPTTERLTFFLHLLNKAAGRIKCDDPSKAHGRFLTHRKHPMNISYYYHPQHLSNVNQNDFSAAKNTPERRTCCSHFQKFQGISLPFTFQIS